MREVALPASAQRLSTLGRIDYSDAFLVKVARPGTRTPLQWARAILEDTPPAFRASAPLAWRALGLKHGMRPADRFVLGWPVRRSTDEYVLLGAESRFGMPAELLIKGGQTDLLFATLIQHGNPLVRTAWAAIARPHRQVVRDLLERANRL